MLLSFVFALSFARETPTTLLRQSFPRLAEEILSNSAPGPVALSLHDGHFSLTDGALSIRVREDAPGAATFWSATTDGQEEWLLTTVPNDGIAARWTVEHGTLHATPDGHFTVCDEQTTACLEVTAPRAYVSPERPVPVHLSAQGQVLAVHVEAPAGELALIDPAWKHGTPILVSRRRLAAVLLPDGRVLAAGGTNQFVDGGGTEQTPLNTAEIYDPLTAKWSPATNTMRFARENFTGIALPNGLVLLSGGSGGISYSELFDPETDSFDAGSLSLQNAHTDHALSLLPDGTVILTGGLAERYDPATNSWSTLLHQPNDPHVAGIAQPVGPLDGQFQILVAVGLNGSNFVNASEIYDPINQTWSVGSRIPATGNLFNSYSSVAGRFADGTIVIHAGAGAAGGTAVSNVTASAWSQPTGLGLSLDGVNGTGGMLPNGSFIFCNGATGPYTQGPDCEIVTTPLATTRSKVDTNATGDWMAQASAVLMPSGRLMIVGGIYNGIDRNGLTITGLIDPSVPFIADGGTLNSGVAFHSATLMPSGAVLLAGGATSGGMPTTTAQRYVDGGALDTAPLALARVGHSGTLLNDGRVLIAGGQTSGGISPTTELYDPATNTWQAGPPLQAGRAYHTATTLPDGTVVVAGGVGVDGGALKSAERYQWVDGGWAWQPAGAFQGVARSNHVATLLANGRILVATGRLGATALNSAEQYNPQTNSWATLPQPLPVAVYDATATLLPTGGVLVVGGTVTAPSVAETNSASLLETDGGWRALPTAPHARARHAAALTTNNQVLIAGGALSSTGAVRDVDVFDFETESWATIGQTTKGHESGTATLLPSGQVLIAGGATPVGSNETNVEVVDEGRFAVAGSVPTLDPFVTSGPTLQGTTLSVTGSRFAGLNWGMGGIRGSPPSNLPLISLERQGNEQRFFARISGWTPTSTSARIPPQAPSGWYWVRATVNGVTGPAQPLFIGPVFDAGTSPVDAGTAADAGTTTRDSGSEADAGTPDSGATEADAGTTDAGLALTDAGTTTDAGAAVDAGSTSVDAGADAGGTTSTDAGTTPADAGGEADGGVTPSPGLYGCLCGSTGTSGSSLAFFGALILIAAVRRRSSVGFMTALVLVLGPLTVQAAATKAKATKTKPGEPTKAPTPQPEEPPKPEPTPVVTTPPPAPTPAPAPASKRAGGRIKVAVLPLDCGPGVQKELAQVITDAVASALSARKELDVISARDVAARLGFERQRELLGGANTCSEDNVQCMVEVGNALGVDRIAFGSLARLGGSAVLSTTVVALAGSDVVRHTERVKSLSEEAFFDAIAPTVDALFPSGTPAGAGGTTAVVETTSANPDLDGTHLSLTVRGQMAPLNLPLGAWVVHADWNFNESFSAGLGAIVAKPFGVMARGTWVPINSKGRLRPLVSLEVPVLFATGAPAVGLGAALGVEFRIMRHLAVGAEVPVSYYFVAPANSQHFWLFGALTLTGRL